MSYDHNSAHKTRDYNDVVRVIAFWYQTQPMCIKWDKNKSDYVNVSNGVRQGGVLSPKLFAIIIY